MRAKQNQQTSCCQGQHSANHSLAEQLKALGNPARLQIVEKLREMDTPCCGEVCGCLPLAQSTISQHLDVLKRAGLVLLKQQGTRSLYSLNFSAFRKLSAEIAEIGQGETASQPMSNIQKGA